MSCDCTKDVQAYHDGELPVEQAEALERHLATCAACRQELADLRRMSQMLRDAPLAQPSAMTMQRLAGALRGTQEQSIRRLAGWLTATAAAIVVVATATRPEAQPPAVPASGVELLALDTASEPLPETLLAARWMALDLDVVGVGGLEQ